MRRSAIKWQISLLKQQQLETQRICYV